MRSYLVSQAERKTFGELRVTVEDARAGLLAAIEGVSEDQAQFKPTPLGTGDEDAWSIAEVVRHCIQNEEAVALCVRALALGDQARPASIGRVVGRTNSSLSDLVRDLRAANFALDHAVGSVEGKEKLEPTATHQFFGELNCRAWFLFQRIHDIDHTRQIEKIKADPAYPG